MADRVHTAAERPFDEIEHVGIAITILMEARNQRHVGILHRDDSSQEPRDREGDEEWQKHVIEALIQTGASSEHIRNVQSELGAARCRPAEIAGAGAADFLPAPFEEAERLGRKIVAKLEMHGLYA